MGEAKGKVQLAFAVPTDASVRALLFADDVKVHNKFKQQCADDVEALVTAGLATWLALRAASKSWPHEKRARIVWLFLHGAFSSALSSMHFLVSGYGLASGNAMRQSVEGIAMGLLMLTDAEYMKFDVQQNAYPAQRAPSRILQKKVQSQLRQIVDITHKDWLSCAGFGGHHP